MILKEQTYSQVKFNTPEAGKYSVSILVVIILFILADDKVAASYYYKFLDLKEDRKYYPLVDFIFPG